MRLSFLLSNVQQLLLEDSYIKVVKCILAVRQQELKIGERGEEKKKTSVTETYERWREEENEEEEGGQDYVTAGLNVSASVAVLLFNHA